MAFTFDKDVIEVSNLDLMALFSRFHPINTSVFLDGIVLADNIKLEKGAIVLSKDSELTHEKFKRLLSMREANPKTNFSFRLQRNDKLIAKFRQEIMERLLLLLDRRMKTRMFRDLASLVSADLTSVADMALSSTDLVLTLQQMRFCCDHSKLKKSVAFMDQAFNSAIMALALTRTPMFRETFGSEREKAVPLFSAALVHNYGAAMNLEALAELPDQERNQMYWSLVLKGLKKQEQVSENEVFKFALETLYGYQIGRRDFIRGEDFKTVCANILIVIEYFLRREGGLFGEPDEPRRVVDRMNVQAFEHQMCDKAVQALTLSLNLKDIFDFYSEMDRLLSECPYEAATPYPLTGFRSPTLFVCRKRVTACRWIELSVRAVKLIVKLGELAPNDYHRCKLLTPKLMDFYAEFYDEIKEETSGTQPKAAPAPPIQFTSGPDKPADKAGEKAEAAKGAGSNGNGGAGEQGAQNEPAAQDNNAPFNDSLSQMFDRLPENDSAGKAEESKKEDTASAS